MQTVALSWQHSFETAAALVAVGGAAALTHHAKLRAAGAFLREAATIAALYGMWQLAGRLSLHDPGNAYNRARWIERVEHDVRVLPSEHDVQHLILGHRLIVEAANLYYATMHFTVMFIFLIWLFWRHREHYRPVRQVMAWTTLGCLLIQLVPVAPPRMMGLVDTGKLYGQSVYSNGLAADQLSAMPSVHVAWSVLVGYYAWRIGRSRLRWLGPAHAAVTIFVVVSTGNHWWSDGIVAVCVLVICAWSVYGVRRAWHAVLARWRRPIMLPVEDSPAFAATTAGSRELPSSAAQTP